MVCVNYSQDRVFTIYAQLQIVLKCDWLALIWQKASLIFVLLPSFE